MEWLDKICDQEGGRSQTEIVGNTFKKMAKDEEVPV
jgi:hypothetical protein